MLADAKANEAPDAENGFEPKTAALAPPKGLVRGAAAKDEVGRANRFAVADAAKGLEVNGFKGADAEATGEAETAAARAGAAAGTEDG